MVIVVVVVVCVSLVNFYVHFLCYFGFVSLVLAKELACKSASEVTYMYFCVQCDVKLTHPYRPFLLTYMFLVVISFSVFNCSNCFELPS